MPVNPQHPCNHPGCNVLTDETYCPRHAAQEAGRKRAGHRAYKGTRTDGMFYSSPPWRKVRARQLIDHPLCVDCAKWGRVRAATVVDHIVPIKLGGASLDILNLQSLCASCHNAKTGTDKKLKITGRGMGDKISTG